MAPAKAQTPMPHDAAWPGVSLGPAGVAPEWKAGTSWPRRAAVHSRPPDIFPLPVPLPPATTATTSRHRRRTQGRRQDVYEEVVDAVIALNGPYGTEPPPVTQGRTEAQAAVHRRLFDSVARGRPKAVPGPDVAARELLGERYEYLGSATSVRAYGTAAVSLPKGLRPPVDMAAALGPRYAQVLSEDMMLLNEDELQDELALSPPGAYLDEVFWRDEHTYESFLGQLVKVGLLGAVAEVSSYITPFFVSKKNGTLRVIWDCRRSNRFFRPPPGLDMGAGDFLRELEVPQGATLLAAQADIAYCYYQCQLPAGLKRFFGVKRVKVYTARQMGLTTFDDGSDLPAEGTVELAIRVFPMGWTWGGPSGSFSASTRRSQGVAGSPFLGA